MSRSVPFEQTVHYRLVCVALLLLWIGFLYPNLEDSNDALAAASAAQGTWQNQLVIVAWAALGLFHLPAAWRNSQSRQGRNLVLLALAYCGWSACTYLWSIESDLTVRRFLAFALMLIGCWGVGAGFYPRTEDGLRALGRHFMYAAFIAALMLLPSRLAGRTLAELMSPTFNLKDAARPAALTYPTGYGFLSALIVFDQLPIQRWATLAFYFLLLVFMKGRTMLGDVLAAATILASRLTMDRLIARVLLILGIIQTAFYGDLGTGGRLFVAWVIDGYDSIAPFMPWITIGGGLKDLMTLNGRLPLWTAMYEHISMQPWLGHGFGAFWTEEHMNQVFRLIGWHAVVAHSGFLDEILATGVIGLVLFMAIWIYGMALSLDYARYYDRPTGHLVFGWLLLYLLFNTMDSVNQSFYKAPFFMCFTGLFALAAQYAEPAPPAPDEPRPQPVELETIA